jgi:hypothetical protein
VASAWFSSLRKVLIATATFAVGASTKLFPSLTIRAYLGLGALVFILVSVEEFFTSLRPAARLAAVAPAAMDGIAAPILKILQDAGVVGRMSMFRTVRPARWLWFRRYFKVKWTSNMQNQVDSDISFPVKNGVSGQCFGDGNVRLVNAEGLAKYPLPKRIAKKVKGLDLQAVFCVAVYEPPRGQTQSGKRIGVLHLDSRDSKAYALIEGKKQEINEKMAKLAGLSAVIYQ